jgi:hypothetical protein
MPEEERENARAARKAEYERKQAERERKEYLEAIKPHNFWSFLGLGSK